MEGKVVLPFFSITRDARINKKQLFGLLLAGEYTRRGLVKGAKHGYAAAPLTSNRLAGCKILVPASRKNSLNPEHSCYTGNIPVRGHSPIFAGGGAMAFIPVPDTAKVVFELDTNGQAWSFALYFSQPGFTDTDLEDLLTALDAGIVTDLGGYLTTVTNFNRLVGYDMRAVDGVRIINPSIVAGADADPPVSVNTAMVISYYASGRGKWNQGRVYLTGLPENSLDERAWTEVLSGLILGIFDSLIDNPPTGWQWVVVSRYLNNLPRTTAAIAPVKTASIRNTVAGSQRKRLRKT